MRSEGRIMINGIRSGRTSKQMSRDKCKRILKINDKKNNNSLMKGNY